MVCPDYEARTTGLAADGTQSISMQSPAGLFVSASNIGDVLYLATPPSLIM